MSLSLFDFIKQQVSILDVVQEYVALKPAGNYWKGPSPFKQERVPSFTVTPSRGIYYCFSTATGGDVIDFIARVENCSPLEAAWYLVKQYNLVVPESISKTIHSPVSSYADLQRYELVCDFFSRWCMLQLARNSRARTYVAERGFDGLINAFRIGYCPGGARGVQELLVAGRDEGILLQDFESAQLIRSGTRGKQLLFEERVVFTIFSAQGGPCGFGGRVFLPGDDRPKYVNSQDHVFFNKRALLYGFSHAKKSIQERSAVYLVEGYADCLAMVQHGYSHTVATLGTACSLEHLQLLARHAQKIYLVYDGDEAGQRAMMRLVSLCWQAHMDPYVISFPPEDDPASFLAREGSLENDILTVRPLFNFFVERLGRSFLRQSMSQKLQATRQVVEAVLLVSDSLQRNMLLQEASEAFGIPFESLYQQYRSCTRTALSAPTKLGENVVEGLQLSELSVLEKRILYAIIKHGHSVFSAETSILPLILSSKAARLYQMLQGLYEPGAFLNGCDEESRPIFVGLVAEGEAIGDVSLSAVRDEIHRRAWLVQISEIKRELAQAQSVGDKERSMQALQALQDAKKKMLSRGNG